MSACRQSRKKSILASKYDDVPHACNMHMPKGDRMNQVVVCKVSGVGSRRLPHMATLVFQRAGCAKVAWLPAHIKLVSSLQAVNHAQPEQDLFAPLAGQRLSITCAPYGLQSTKVIFRQCFYLIVDQSMPKGQGMQERALLACHMCHCVCRTALGLSTFLRLASTPYTEHVRSLAPLTDVSAINSHQYSQADQ